MAGGQGWSQGQGEGQGHVIFINLISNSHAFIFAGEMKGEQRDELLSLNSPIRGNRMGKNIAS